MTEPTPRSDWVTFLSDYGLDDHLVGVCKGVVARIAPHVRIIDVCHQVKAQDVLIGATMLAEAMPYLPVPAVHLALVDPFRATSARGIAFAEVGTEVDPRALDGIETVPPYPHGDHVHGAIRMVDHFGNLALNVRRSDLEAAGIQLGDLVELRCSGKVMEVPFTLAFGDVQTGRTVVCEDAFRAITIAVNSGRADRVLRASPGDPIVLSRVHRQSAPAAGTKLGVVDAPPSPVA